MVSGKHSLPRNSSATIATIKKASRSRAGKVAGFMAAVLVVPMAAFGIAAADVDPMVEIVPEVAELQPVAPAVPQVPSDPFSPTFNDDINDFVCSSVSSAGVACNSSSPAPPVAPLVPDLVIPNVGVSRQIIPVWTAVSVN